MAGLSQRDAVEVLIELRNDVLGQRGLSWEQWSRQLSGLDGRDWLLLDKLARRGTWTPPILHGVRGWSSLDLARAPVPALAAAAMHVDGRLREQAVGALARHSGPVSSAVLGLRLLDHVEEVAAAARDVVRARPSGLEVDLVAEVLLEGADRRAAGARWDGLVDALGLDTPPVLDQLRASTRRRARRWAVEQSLDRGLLDEDTVLRIAAADPDQWLRRAASEHLVRTPTPERLGSLLGAPSVEARLTAVTRTPDELLDASVMETLVLDRSPRVREQARWRARRRGVDVADVCRRRLDDPAPRIVAAALDGLAWYGDETDVRPVTRLLDHSSPTVRAAAVRTFAARAPAELAVRTLAPRPDDPSGRVGNAAATVLARAHAAPSSTAGAWRSPRPTARLAAWRVDRAAGGWARVAADLRAAADPDGRLAGLGRDGLRGWLVDGAASTWGRPDPEQVRTMTDHLGSSDLSAVDEELIAFHAGLPFERREFTAAPAPASGATQPPRPTERRGLWSRLHRRSR